MAKGKAKSLPPLTPRSREIVTFVVNTVALGTHDDDAEAGAVAKAIGMTPARLKTTLRKLEEQGWLKVKNDFVYPTVAALQWQEPGLSDSEASKILRALR